GGWFGEAKPGGFPRVAGFHIGLYLRKVPTVNPSVTAAPCQLPLAREPLGCSDEAPLAKGGCLGLPRRGDSAGKACGTSYLFPLHYSLKNLPLSTWVRTLGKPPL